MEIALSNVDIEKMLNGKTKILSYPELSEYNDIQDILKKYGNFVLLYLTAEDFGHWCCVIDHPNRGSIEFFDSYGIVPDLEFKEIKNRKELGEGLNYLSYLLLKSKKKIEYNSKQLQEYKNGIATCGRHCIVRIWAKNIPIDLYSDILLKNKEYTPDEFVVAATDPLLKKEAQTPILLCNIF